MDNFSALALSIFFRILTHGQGFQNTRCPAVENLHEISHWICVKTSESYLENSGDFKYCFGLEVEATVEPSWPIFAVLAFASRNNCVMQMLERCNTTIIVVLHRKLKGTLSAESTNFTLFCNSGGYLLRLQTLYNFTYKSSRLSRCRKRFSWKYSENFRLPGI